MFSKESKIEKKVLSALEKNIPKKFGKLSPYFEHQDDVAISAFEKVVQDVVLTKPHFHQALGDLFFYLLIHPKPALFQLFFESILANGALYDVLKKQFRYETDADFYHFLLQKAENYPDKETSHFALGVLMVLYDSFQG